MESNSQENNAKERKGLIVLTQNYLSSSRYSFIENMGDISVVHDEERHFDLCSINFTERQINVFTPKMLPVAKKLAEIYNNQDRNQDNNQNKKYFNIKKEYVDHI
jgi:hypothetical protein